MSTRAHQLEPFAVVHLAIWPALLAKDRDRDLLKSPAAKTFIE